MALLFQSFDGWRNDGTESLPKYVATFTKAVCLYNGQKVSVPEETLRIYLAETPKGLDGDDYDRIDDALKAHPRLHISA